MPHLLLPELSGWNVGTCTTPSNRRLGSTLWWPPWIKVPWHRSYAMHYRPPLWRIQRYDTIKWIGGYAHDVTSQEKHSCVAVQYGYKQISGYAHDVDYTKNRTGGYIHGASQECVTARFAPIRTSSCTNYGVNYSSQSRTTQDPEHTSWISPIWQSLLRWGSTATTQTPAMGP